jgi:hypothetical protein
MSQLPKIRADKAKTYHKLTLLAGEGMTRLDDLSGNLINEDSFLPRLQSFQRSLFGYPSELFILNRKAIELFTDGSR